MSSQDVPSARTKQRMCNEHCQQVTGLSPLCSLPTSLLSIVLRALSRNDAFTLRCTCRHILAQHAWFVRQTRSEHWLAMPLAGSPAQDVDLSDLRRVHHRFISDGRRGGVEDRGWVVRLGLVLEAGVLQNLQRCVVERLTLMKRLKLRMDVTVSGDLGPRGGGLRPLLHRLGHHLHSLEVCCPMHWNVCFSSLFASNTSLQSLAIPGGASFTHMSGVAHLTNLNRLAVQQCVSLANVSGLAQLSVLRELELYQCYKLRSLEVLQKLNLTKLHLSGTGHPWESLTNFSGLAHLVNLRCLKLCSFYFLTDVDMLAPLAQLTSLDLSDCESLSDLDGLAGLTALTSIDLSGCMSFTNVDGLAALAGLEALRLKYCLSLMNIEGLKPLTRLVDLNLGHCTCLADVNALQTLHRLRRLKLKGCTTSVNIDGIRQLTQLVDLSISGCKSLSLVQYARFHGRRALQTWGSMCVMS